MSTAYYFPPGEKAVLLVYSGAGFEGAPGGREPVSAPDFGAETGPLSTHLLTLLVIIGLVAQGDLLSLLPGQGLRSPC